MTECSDYVEPKRCPYKIIGPFLYQYLLDEAKKLEAYKEVRGIKPDMGI